MSNELDLTKYGDDNRKDWTCTCSTFDRYKGNVAYIINDRSYCVVFDRNLVNDAPLLLAEVKRLRAEVEQLKELNISNVAVIQDVRRELYGQNLMVQGWHQNGALEPLDSWFEQNNWQPKGDER